jgi:hypothetical protein
LLCLANLLQALGFEPWRARQPAPARRPFVNALWTQTLAKCGASHDDPQCAWFAVSPAEADVLSSAQFIDGGTLMDAQRALRRWRLRMRRALRRRVAMHLAAVVQRQAWVSATATHLDVIFPLDEVDLRLRRRGLDSDPGWVPWLARIVTFHFVAADGLPRRESRTRAPDG